MTTENQTYTPDSEVVYGTELTERPTDTPLSDKTGNTPSVSDGGAALDSLFKAAGGVVETEKPKVETSAAVVEQVIEEKLKTEVTPPVTKVETPATVVEPGSEDALDKVALPPHVSQKSKDAFASIKATARLEITQREEKITNLTKELETAKSGNPLSDADRKHFEELIKFRETHDFKGSKEYVTKYVEPLKKAEDAIIAKFKEAGGSDEQVAELRKLGMTEANWEEVYKFAPQLRRFVDARLVEIDDIKAKEKSALEEAAKRPGELAEREKLAKAEIARAEEATIKAAAEVFTKDPQWKEKTIPASATPAEKKAIEEDNAFVREQHKRLQTCLSSTKPEWRAEIAATAVEAFRYKRDADRATARVTELEKEVARLRGASGTSAAASPNQAPVVSSKAPSLTESGDDALTRLWKESNTSTVL